MFGLATNKGGYNGGFGSYILGVHRDIGGFIIIVCIYWCNVFNVILTKGVNNMNSLAELKRRCTEGAELTMVHHGWFPDGKLIGLSRKIKRVQSNSIQFDPADEGSNGSWLDWPKAKDVLFFADDENRFAIALNPEEGVKGPKMVYKID
jgi:hypothetical protein